LRENEKEPDPSEGGAFRAPLAVFVPLRRHNLLFY